MKYLWSAATVLLVTLPNLALAEDGIPDISGDFVPCGDPGLPSCQTCHIYVLIDNVFTWVFGMAFVVTAIIIVIGGLRMATAGGNQVGKHDARRWIRTAAFGFVLIMSAWIIVDLLIATLYGEPDAAGIWSSFECVDQPDPVAGPGIESIEADAVPNVDPDLEGDDDGAGGIDWVATGEMTSSSRCLDPDCLARDNSVMVPVYRLWRSGVPSTEGRLCGLMDMEGNCIDLRYVTLDPVVGD